MNVQELFDFLAELGTTVLNPPVHPFKSEWKKIYNSIKPHFYGEVPPALEKAFPNEEPIILNYRKDTYQPKTESPLVKAITELNRLLSNAKHSVKYENKRMEEYMQNKEFGDTEFSRYFFNIFVPYRILDPNAVLLVEPFGDGVADNSTRVDIDLKIIQSDRIVFNDPEYKLLIYKGISKNKYAGIGIQYPIYYHIVTDNFFAVVNSNSDTAEFEIIYQHDSSVMPWVTLGGRAVPMFDSYGNSFKVYKSDFSPAIPYLNDAAIFDNQHKSVMLAACFPIKFVEGVDCNSCHGLGKTHNHDTDTAEHCNSCGGTGKTLSISPLAAYNLNPTVKDFGENKQQVEPIRYYSPDVSSIQEVGKVSTDALNKAEQVLNINRSLNAIQSGAAKELDREPEYIEIGKISDDVYGRYHDILKAIQALVFLDTNSVITVNAPISFDLKTETELMQEFANSQKGLPASIRFEAYISYVDRRFSSDFVARRIAALCAMYSSTFLFTIEERNLMLASGQITPADAIAAQFVFDAVTTLYYEKDLDVMSDDWQMIKTAIDNELAPRLDAAVSMPLPEVDMNEFNNEDEDETE
jgi:hypothetical protein